MKSRDEKKIVARRNKTMNMNNWKWIDRKNLNGQNRNEKNEKKQNNHRAYKIRIKTNRRVERIKIIGQYGNIYKLNLYWKYYNIDSRQTNDACLTIVYHTLFNNQIILPIYVAEFAYTTAIRHRHLYCPQSTSTRFPQPFESLCLLTIWFLHLHTLLYLQCKPRVSQSNQ